MPLTTRNSDTNEKKTNPNEMRDERKVKSTNNLLLVCLFLFFYHIIDEVPIKFKVTRPFMD